MSGCVSCLGGCVVAGLCATGVSRWLAVGATSRASHGSCSKGAEGVVLPEAHEVATKITVPAVEEPPLPETDDDLEALARKKQLAKLGGDASKALYEAVEMGDFEQAFAALECGADIAKGFTSRSNTALHVVARTGNQGLLGLLLRQPGCKVDVFNREGETPLLKAVRAGEVGATQMLVDAQADVNATDSAGQTALSIAASRGRQDFIDFLTMHGAKA